MTFKKQTIYFLKTLQIPKNTHKQQTVFIWTVLYFWHFYFIQEYNIFQTNFWAFFTSGHGTGTIQGGHLNTVCQVESSTLRNNPLNPPPS